MIMEIPARPGLGLLLLRGIVWIVAVCLFLLVCLAPLEARDQAIFAIGTCTVLILFNHVRSRFVTLLLVFLSLLVSTRYMIWRASDTLPYSNMLDLVLGVGLLLAELYNLLGLGLGYLQTAWPLHRRPVLLPADRSLWPSVDVYIPTYSEKLDVVRHTVLAASCLDWPADKLAIYLLDDGRREEFREFAAAAGVGYLTRLDNKGAKAGNLNNAMNHSSGTFVAIFDCDHIPTRAFLQMTLGWFLKDPQLATVQTPHHFYSPDPFDRNLHLGHLVPTEGNLFYGLIQDGKDLWNSAFFCGSCAVLRRSALDKIGGFSTQSVTEDALTALRLSRAGFNSAYLRLPLAAGLATERLALHIGQRVRWARGMVQILRIDNPLTGPGLSLPQRLSYLAASLYFLFPLPRIIFLTAPLAYLLLGINLISTPVGVLTAYLVPHFAHSLITSSRLNRQHRYAFWDEVYETVLAFHLIWPTLKTAISPKAIAFNVTAKGGDVEEGFVDTGILWPHMILAGLLVLGLLAGLVRYGLAIETDVLGATAMNMLWGAFNLILVATSIAVGHESRQVRHDVRIDTHLPVTLHLVGGHTRIADAVNISMGGALIQTVGTDRYETGQEIGISLPIGRQAAYVKARVVGRDANHLRLHFMVEGLAQERDLVQAVFGRADAWTDWAAFPPDSVLKSLVMMVRLAARALRWPVRRSLTLLPVLLVLSALAVTPVWGQAIATDPAVRQATYKFTRLGVADDLELRSSLGEASLPFSIRGDEVVTGASLHLSYTASPDLLAGSSRLEVLWNGEPVRRIDLPTSQPGPAIVAIPLEPFLFTSQNRLQFRFIGHIAAACEDPFDPRLWLRIHADSALIIESRRLPLPDDLAILPRPFFDTNDLNGAVAAFTFARQPTSAALEAAGLFASWLGSLSADRGTRFTAILDSLQPGDQVVFATPQSAPTLLEFPQIDGPTVMVTTNPVDVTSKLLLILGRTDDELKTAVRGLILGHETLKGPRAELAPAEIAQRLPYDAPRWSNMERPQRLGDLVPADALQSQGIRSGSVQVDFHSAPDLYGAAGRLGVLTLAFQHDEGKWIDLRSSHLNVTLNGQFLRDLSFWPPLRWRPSAFFNKDGLDEQRVLMPPAYLTGRNRLRMHFDYRAKPIADCQASLPTNVQSRISPDSVLDLSELHHFAVLPNLAFIANSGFPYTRMADLSETALILPVTPTEPVIELMLSLLGLFGYATGYPAFGLTLVTPDQLDGVANRDLLLIGGPPELAADARLQQAFPLRLDDSSLRVTSHTGWRQVQDRLLIHGTPTDVAAADLSARKAGSRFALMAGAESPLHAGRSLVVVLAPQPDRLRLMSQALVSQFWVPRFQGDLVIVTEEGVEAHHVAATYSNGTLPTYEYVRWALGGHLLLLSIATLLSIGLLAAISALALRRLARFRLAAASNPEGSP